MALAKSSAWLQHTTATPADYDGTAQTASKTGIAYDLSGAYGAVIELRIYNHNGTSATDPTSTPGTLTVLISGDGTNWAELQAVQGGLGSGDSYSWAAELPFATYYIRVDFTAADVSVRPFVRITKVTGI